MREDQIERSLKYDFTADEVADLSQRLAAEMIAIEVLEDEKAEAASQFAEDIKFHRTSAKKLARQVKDKAEYRFIKCKTLWNAPAVGQKTIVRLDTGEEVGTEPMSEAERQEELPLPASEQPTGENLFPAQPANGNGTPGGYADRDYLQVKDTEAAPPTVTDPDDNPPRPQKRGRTEGRQE